MRTAFADARANPGAFWTQLAAMVANDVAWVAFWFIFFARVRSLRGWEQGDVLLLLAVLTTGGGLVTSVLTNSRRIGQLIANGSIDAALTLPCPPLAYLLVRRFDAVNAGDVVFGLVLFGVSGAPTPTRTAAYLFGSLVGAAVLTGFLITVGSLTFFTGRGEAGDLGFNAMLLLSAYPVDLFAGAAKVVLFTVIPAAFVAAVPARLVSDFDPIQALLLAAVATAFVALGWTTFTLGLRRYTSSALWTRA